MLSDETIEEYRRMTPGQRLKLTLQMIRENIPYLLRGTPEQVDRRFELLRRENDLRERADVGRHRPHAVRAASRKRTPSAMSDLDRVLRDFAEVFDAYDVPYAIMGGISEASRRSAA